MRGLVVVQDQEGHTYRIMNCLSKGGGTCNFQPPIRGGSVSFEQERRGGPQILRHHFSNCSGQPPLVLTGQSLNELKYYIDKNAHLIKRRFQIAHLFKCNMIKKLLSVSAL